MGQILRTRSELEQHLTLSEDGCYSAVYGSFILKSAFQPIIHVSGERFGYEALLRIFDESGALLKTEPFFTSEFIEASDRINFDRLAKVIHLRNFARFLSEGALFLNMSPLAALDTDSHLLTQHSLLPRIKELGLSTGQLYLEILEHNCICDQALADSVRNMKCHGLQIAMDDYGIDGSSENRARKVRPDIIKADRSLMAKYMAGQPEDLIALLVLAEELDAKVLVEGVEDQHCFEMGRQLGIDYMQGYYVGHPRLVGDCSHLLEPA